MSPATERNNRRAALTAALRGMLAQAGISQAELARRMNSTPQVVNRFFTNSSEYGRAHTLTTLYRIADAMGYELRIEFIPKKK